MLHHKSAGAPSAANQQNREESITVRRGGNNSRMIDVLVH